MESFRECGWPSFAALGVGSLALVAGIVALALALIKPRTGFIVGIVALAIAFGPAGVGFMGMLLGRQVTDNALSGESVSPEQKERIREVGYAEASQCVNVGATIGIVPMIMAGIAIAVGAVRVKGETQT